MTAPLRGRARVTWAETMATATAALRTMARGLGRAVAYLLPLLVAALGYIARLCADAVSALAALIRRHARRKASSPSLEDDRQEAVRRDARAKRWTEWQALPAARRFAVRVAAASLVIAVAALVQARVGAPVRPEEKTPSASAETPAARGDVPRRQPEAPPTVDFGAAAARFGEARQRLGPGEWAAFSEAHVLDRGARGTWDDFGVSSPIVMTDTGAAGRAARYRMWYVGCHLAMREHSCGVGHATSSDGVVWDRRPQPVFMPADSVAQDNLTEIAVVRTGERYFLWYSVAVDYPAGRRRATVNLATSPDGLVWTDQGQVLEGEDRLPLAIVHSVVHDGQRFHMWYVAAMDRRRPVLWHLSSTDGKAWIAVGGTPVKSLRQNMEDTGRLMVEMADGGVFRAWFALPNEDQSLRSKTLGALVSPDGTTWEMQPADADPFTKMLERQASLRIRTVTAVRDPGGLWLWVTLVAASQHDQCIGVAFRKGR